MSDNSDYKKPHIELSKLLPEVHREGNETIISNVFERYLSKTDLTISSGSLRKLRPTDTFDQSGIKPLEEETVGRQAWQLQPMMHTKIASVDHLASWEDMLNKAQRLGISTDRLPKWANTTVFNFVPPISIDKIVNYQNYFWVDYNDDNTDPQYITIRNLVTTYTAQLDALTAHLAERTDAGADQDELDEINALIVDVTTLHDAAEVEYLTNQWVTQNKWVHKNDIGEDATIKQAKIPIIEYDPTVELNEWTYVKHNWKYRKDVTDPWEVSDTEPTNAEISTRYQITNKLVTSQEPWQDAYFRISGNYAAMFVHGFQFSIENWDTNAVSDWTVQTSTFNGTSTIIYAVEPINNDIVTGNYIVPFITTSKGDSWKGFLNQWLLIDQESPIPIENQPENTLEPTKRETFTLAGPSSWGNRFISVAVTIAGGQFVYDPGIIGYEAVAYDNMCVAIHSTGQLPAPLQENKQYFIKRTTGYNFYLSLQPGGPGITLTSAATGTLSVRPLEFTLTNSTAPHLSGLLRVYVNGIRQYGNYIVGFRTNLASPLYTYGDSGTNKFAPVNTIRFKMQGTTIVPKNDDVIVIETYPASANDIGRTIGFVRTDEDEDFIVVEMPLVRYFKQEQAKTETNQYPLFNVYSVDGTHANFVSPLFSYIEDSSMPVNHHIGRRIKTSNQRKEYYFNNALYNATDDALYCYRDNDAELHTVWRKGLNNEQYVPKYTNQYRLATGDTYVDSDGDEQVTNVVAGEGTWGVPDTMFFNPEHDVRTTIKFSEMFSHFQSIIRSQEFDSDQMPYAHAPNGYRFLIDANYGLGGTIKEYNNSFDTFLSALFQETTNPLAVISFAQTSYDTFVDLIRRDFLVDSITPLIGYAESYTGLIDNIVDSILTRIAQNDLYDVVYGDSSAYDGTDGIKNWISTMPMFELWYKIRPYIVKDTTLGIHKLRHHDGHFSNIKVSNKERDRLVDEIIEASNGLKQTTRPPYTLVSNGLYWLNTITHKLYRFTVAVIRSTTPSASHFTEGVFWYDPVAGLLYVRDLNALSGWATVTGIVGDVDAAWNLIDTSDVLAEMLYRVEQKLFNVSPQPSSLKFDYSTLTATNDEKLHYTECLRDAFFDYTRYHDLDPFATDYNPNNAFTWNYKYVNTDNVNYPTSQTATTKPWGARCTVIYQKLFGTAFPHLEPWCLQGYTNKPTWWDAQYLVVNGSRRWIYDSGTDIGMWANIRQGIVPAGKLLPSGATSTGAIGAVTQYFYVPVNVNNSTVDGYLPDGLLPPYYHNDLILNNEVPIRNLSYIPLGSTAYKYTFGDIGPAEYRWRESSDYVYAQLKVAFRMQPCKLLHQVFGPIYTTIDGLDIDLDLEHVYNHKDIIFHGSQETESEAAAYDGLNQWYANYMRYHNFDINLSDLVNKWKTWKPQLSYGTDTFIDPKSLSLASTNYTFNREDYQVLVKETQGETAFDLDALRVTVQTIGSYGIGYNSKIPRGDGFDWTFKVDIVSRYNKPIQYYPVQKYTITEVNTTTNTFTVAQTLPWETGEYIKFKSSSNLPPAPLSQVNDYFAIIVDSHHFKVAESPTNAQLGIAIDITTTGGEALVVGAISNSFTAINGKKTSEVWRNYKLDKSAGLITVTPPFYVTGVQGVIDFIFGYIQVQTEKGFLFNHISFSEQDYTTNRAVSWQVEIERLIDQIYTGLGTTTAVLNQEDATILNAKFHEVNPFRNNIWFAPVRGVVADIFRGVNTDIKTVPAIYDQNGTYLTTKECQILRQDTLTRITLDHNNVPANAFTPYVNRHLGGMRLYVNTFEHAIVLNDSSLDGVLIYDPFLGLQIPEMFVEFARDVNSSGRPNIGGYFLNGQTIEENLETLTDNVRLYYDTYQVNETANHLEYARALLGYQDPTYLADLGNVGPKSRFVFWKGMIQHKGTLTAVKAIVNARALSSATIDEFWAYKVGQFGDSKRRQLTEIKVLHTDVVKNQLKYQFVTTKDDPIVVGFTAIALNDTSRWIDQPAVLSNMEAQNRASISFDCLLEPNNTNVIQPIGSSQRYLKLDRPTDRVVVLFESNNPSEITKVTFSGVINQLTFNTGNGTPSVVNFYIVSSNNISVYLNDVLKQSGTDYIELGSSTIQFYFPVTGTVTIVKKPGILPIAEGNLENARLLRFPTNFNPNLYRLTVYTVNPSAARNNPAYLVDYASGTILHTLDMWDPARGRHHYQASLAVDIRTNIDPARYTYNLAESPISAPIRKREFWNPNNEGLVWLDTSTLWYVPYTDTNVHKDIEDRLANWGKLADFGQLNLWQWTKSTIPPAQWDSAVLEQANDITIQQDEKLSGTPKKLIYYRTRVATTADWDNWAAIQPPRYQEFYRALLPDQRCAITAFPLTIGDLVDVYLNGKYLDRLPVDHTFSTPQVEIPLYYPLKRSATIRIVEIVYVPTKEDIEQQDLEVALIEYVEDYPYVSVVKYDERDQPVDTDFYFWVTDKLNKVRNTGLSLLRAKQLLVAPDTPHLVVQGVDIGNRTPYSTPETFYKYTQAIVNRIGPNLITTNDRIKLRVVEDHTLRDTYSHNLNRIHHEWTMFREKQLNQIPRELWDKMTESMLGHKLTDPDTAVPAINRVIFDRTYLAHTQYGLQDDQTFCDKETALTTIRRELSSSEHNLYPIDREWFLNNYNFYTSTDIIRSMDYMYLNFPSFELNRIFFSLLNDALCVKPVSTDLMKTSYISLSGEQQLPVPIGL